jgi:retinol-binding protein 3
MLFSLLMRFGGFVEPEFVGDLFAAAITLVANTDALILDFRQHQGGYVASEALFASYFFRDPVQLSSVYWRAEDRTRQWHTLPYVPGPRYDQPPVYILTGPETFSAAEAFAYDLQLYKRATIIGDTTRGGAHLTKGFISPPILAWQFQQGVPSIRLPKQIGKGLACSRILPCRKSKR